MPAVTASDVPRRRSCYRPLVQSSRISRRRFLATTAALPFALRAAPNAARVPVGLELYSVRDALTKDLEGTVRAVAKMGYEVVEFYSPYYAWTPERAKEVRKLLDDLGIRCPSTHNSAQALTLEGLPKAIELNQILGSRYIVMAGAGRVNGATGWKTIADRLTAAADRLKPLGMAAGFHNHRVEWEPVDGLLPMDILASHTPNEVALQLDVGTCVQAGADPVAWINRHPGRIRSIHCKDWSPDRGFAVLTGEGAAPWKKIIEAAESRGGVEYYLIEQEEGPVEEQLLRAERCLANWRKLAS
jgi:sugar phosphate isomerase/epimerase